MEYSLVRQVSHSISKCGFYLRLVDLIPFITGALADIKLRLLLDEFSIKA